MLPPEPSAAPLAARGAGGDAAQQPAPVVRAAASRVSRWLPWVAWLLTVAAAGAFVLVHAPRVPFQDDLELAPHLVPEAELTLEYLWSPHNEHRIPLPRLVLIPLIRATGDFRAGMLLEVAILAGLAAGMILLARRLRGRPSALDAFFPLLWLSLGNAENLLMAFQVSLALAVLASCGVWMLALASPAPPGPGRAAAMGLCLLALPLCGGHGLTQVPALLALVVFAGFAGLRSERARERLGGRIAGASAAATTALVCLYFVGYHRPPGESGSLDPLGGLRAAAELAALSAGPVVWHHALEATLAAGLAVLFTMGWLLVGARREPAERLRYAALLAGLAAVLTMGLSLGLGRSVEPGVGMALRYVMLAAPLPACAWFAALLRGPSRGARLVQVSLLALVALGWPSNAQIGLEYARMRRADGAAFEAERKLGVRLPVLAKRFAPVMYADAEALAARLAYLGEAGFLPSPPAEGALPLLPLSYSSDGVIAMSTLHGVPIVLVQPDGEIVLPVPDSIRSVHGGFGLHPRSFEEGSDGAVFRVELVQADGTRATLLDRALDPAAEPEEAARPQLLRLELPGTGLRQLVLKTSNVPGHGAAGDWTYWAYVGYR